MTRNEAEAYVGKTKKICGYLEDNMGKTAFTCFKGKTITYGRKGEYYHIRCQSGGWYMALKADHIGGEPRVQLSENDDALFMNISEALCHPYVTDTAKALIRAALVNKVIPARDCRKSRVLYSIDEII